MLFYRILISLAAPVLGAMLLWRLLRGQESRADFAQRLGHGPGRPGAIWLHGASNGELTSAKALVQAIRAGFPDDPILISCNTTSARDLVDSWGLDQVTARLAPLDLTWILRKFLRHWRPKALIILENELWPNRISQTPTPIFLIAGRMSARTARRWRFLRPLAKKILSRIEKLYPQDTASGARFVALGLPNDRLGPVVSLKSGVSMEKPPANTLAPLQKIFHRDATVLAASTHEGEEALILQAFTKALKSQPHLRLILAPRHPRRSAEVQALITATGHTHAVRSKAENPDCTVYLADTLGEMVLWYTLAGTAIIGGSFTSRGGHTPFEPAQAGCAIIHGPDVANFADGYAALHSAEAALMVEDKDQLTEAITTLSEPNTQKALANRAAKALAHLKNSDQIISEIVADLTQRLT